MMYALVAIMGLGLVDSYFISFLGTNELAAMGFIVPITFTMTSVSLGLGMAISSLTSKLIGANHMNQAARLITDGFYLTIGTSVLLSLLLAWQLENVFALVGATPEIMPAIMAYMKTWLVGCVFLMLTQVCSSTFRAIGDTQTSANIAIVMTITNLILDPLLIFGLGPFPELGIQGAAIATVVAVFVSFLIGFFQLAVRERLLIATLPGISKFKENFSKLIEIAVPAMLANAIVPLTGAAMTFFVAMHGTEAVAGYGVGGRIEAVCLMVVYALSATLPMFIGQNLGANEKARVAAAIKVSFKFILLLQLLVYAALVLFSEGIASLFSTEEGVIDVIKLFLWIIPISYGFSGIIVLTNVAMNVLGKPKVALYINLFRLAFIYVPLVYIGGQLAEYKGIFIGISFGNFLACIVASVMLLRVLKELEIDLFNK